MNCNDYLAMLETLPVEELDYGSAREHATRCRDCDRVTRVIVERERHMLTAFSDLHSSIPAALTAGRAATIARRRNTVRYVQVGLSILAVGFTFFYWMMFRIPNAVSAASSVSAPAGVHERFYLQCLSPEQAAEVIRPYLTPTTAAVWIQPDSPLGIINVEASPAEMTKVRSQLAFYDNPAQSKCAVKVTVPKPS